MENTEQVTIQPENQPEKLKPQSLDELVSAIDITTVSKHEIITDLIAGIQQLAVRATVALKLLERMKNSASAAEVRENESKE